MRLGQCTSSLESLVHSQGRRNSYYLVILRRLAVIFITLSRNYAIDTDCFFYARYRIGGRDVTQPSVGALKLQGATPLERDRSASNYRNIAVRY
jgi:hypothetical protein